MRYPSAYHAVDLMNRLAGNAEHFTKYAMNRTLQILQLNVRKQREVQQSLMNDDNLRDFGVLMVTEPHVWRQAETLGTAPMGNLNWTRVMPSMYEDSRWAVRSMLWVRKDLEIEQVSIPSSDVTAVLLRLPDRVVLVASVYVPCNGVEALKGTVELLKGMIEEVRKGEGTRTDLVIAGDFNRHDQLWGGDDISRVRQGEAEPIVGLYERIWLTVTPTPWNENVAKKRARVDDRLNAGIRRTGRHSAPVRYSRYRAWVRPPSH